MKLNCQRRRDTGMSLDQCLVYISVLGVILCISGMSVGKAWDAHRAISRSANDIQRAVNAGERWRQEIRSALRPPEMCTIEAQPALRITTAQGVIEYRQCAGTLQRRDGVNGAWLVALHRVRDSQMLALTSTPAPAWRWELEMEPAHKRARLRPLFTFTAVAPEVAR
jgi:hypothetical protein